MAGVKGKSGGQNRKPLELHALHSTGRADRGTKLIGLDVRPKSTIIEPQDWLLDDTVSIDKAAFVKEMNKWLNHRGMSQSVHTHAISLLADTYENYIEIRKIVKTQGVTAVLGRGLAVAQLDNIRKSLRAQMAEFGMTPSSATASHARESYENDPVADVLSGWK